MATMESELRSVIPAGTWKVDPVHSHIGFRVVDTSELLSTITGRFTEFEGVFEAGEQGGDARAHGVIQAASIATDQEQRDAHLRSPDFFETDRYPEISFDTKRIQAVEDERVRIDGTLTIKEQPTDVTLEGRVATGTSAKGEERLVFTSGGGIAWGPMSVDITASISAVKES